MQDFVFDKNAVKVLPEMDIKDIKRKFLDIPYASASEYQTFDLYLPDEGEGPFPLIMTIHGGGFRRGDKRDIQAAGYMKLRNHGFAIASINYRLSFEAIYPAGVHDCKAAVRYIKAHAAELKIDPNRIAAAGGSAGGYYTMMLAVTPHVPEMEDLSMGNAEQSSSIKCAVAMFAETDHMTSCAQYAINEKNGLVNTSDNSRDPDDPNSPEAIWLGGAINALDPEFLKKASPVSYIDQNMPPVLLQHGKGDFIVPYQQSVEVYEKAQAVGREDTTELDLFEGHPHMSPEFQSDENMARVESFLKRYL